MMNFKRIEETTKDLEKIGNILTKRFDSLVSQAKSELENIPEDKKEQFKTIMAEVEKASKDQDVAKLTELQNQLHGLIR